MKSHRMINCEWGLNGINKFREETNVFIVVDVLSFSTCVDIALSRGAVVYPYRYKDETAIEYAKNINAEVALFKRSKTSYSLSPVSLLNIKLSERLVLPSPNGSELSLACGKATTLCACLRNCKAVAEYAMSIDGNITVIPAGEKWNDGSIRFAIEDYIGAGAVISYLNGTLTPESLIAKELFKSVKNSFSQIIMNCESGIELREKGFLEDIITANELNISPVVPLLNNNHYFNINGDKSHIL